MATQEDIDLFNIQEEIIVTFEEYEEIMKKIRHIYNVNNAKEGAKTHTYICKFRKHKRSSGPKVDSTGNMKRRKTNVLPTDLCSTQLKVVFKSDGRVSLCTTQPHNHSLDVSNQYRTSVEVKSLMREEISKKYSSADIANHIRSVELPSASYVTSLQVRLGTHG